MGHRTDNQIIGVCRFSYLGTHGFKANLRHADTLADRLHDGARMAHRFACFETICLPSLASVATWAAPGLRSSAIIARHSPSVWPLP